MDSIRNVWKQVSVMLDLEEENETKKGLENEEITIDEPVVFKKKPKPRKKTQQQIFDIPAEKKSD